MAPVSRSFEPQVGRASQTFATTTHPSVTASALLPVHMVVMAYSIAHDQGLALYAQLVGAGGSLGSTGFTTQSLCALTAIY